MKQKIDPGDRSFDSPGRSPFIWAPHNKVGEAEVMPRHYRRTEYPYTNEEAEWWMTGL